MKYRDAASFRRAIENRIANEFHGDQRLTLWRRRVTRSAQLSQEQGPSGIRTILSADTNGTSDQIAVDLDRRAERASR